MKFILRKKYLITLFLILSQLIFAQQESNEITKQRTLRDHYFTISNITSSPFVLTSLTTSLGIGGISDLKYPIPIGDNFEEKYLQGDLTIALFSFQYQHAVKDWLAVYFGSDINTRLGSDHVTLLKEGLNLSSSFKIGWLIKILRYNDFALSGRIQVNNGAYSIVNIEDYLEEIKSGNENASLIIDKYSTSGIANFNAAYGINYFIGLNGEIGFGYGESIQEEQSSEFFMNASIELDMNFTQLINVPISIILGYNFSSYPANSSMLYFDDGIFLGQLSYIGRADFILSLDLKLGRESYGADDEIIWPTALEFSMRYLF